MATLVKHIEARARQHLVEPKPRFWTSQELIGHINDGHKDLWRSTVDLKQEHYLTVNASTVVYPANSTELTGVPDDVHKVYLIEPRDLSVNGANHDLTFDPLDYNHDRFKSARARDAIDPQGDVILYSLAGPGGPVGAVTIRCAPKVNSKVNLTFSYIPTLQPLTDGNSQILIPGEADNALVAWTVAFARAKEREDHAPDPSWLAIYSSHKQNILQSLGVRQVQEPSFVDAVFADMW